MTVIKQYRLTNTDHRAILKLHVIVEIDTYPDCQIAQRRSIYMISRLDSFL